MQYKFLPLIISVFLIGCSTVNFPAPVEDRTHKPEPTQQPTTQTPVQDGQTYTVQAGDTLYSISKTLGYDYQEVAALNGLEPPYPLSIGQRLTLPLKTIVIPPTEDATTVAEPVELTEPTAERTIYSESAMTDGSTPVVTAPKQPTDVDGIRWKWTAKGNVVETFNPASNKGIDIAGTSGQSVYAAAEGKVIYSGADLRGYGRMVIIKHNASYLSVYAHNKKLIVNEGQVVRMGQKIAEMGQSDANNVKLHFEIRHKGKSVDPMPYLSPKPAPVPAPVNANNS